MKPLASLLLSSLTSVVFAFDDDSELCDLKTKYWDLLNDIDRPIAETIAEAEHFRSVTGWAILGLLLVLKMIILFLYGRKMKLERH
uniref:GOLD domain-containing protein n=1 Tax=Steinernema glaseri TaxID=37863 RepID=A0A1I7Y0H1_9BILA